ncbi:HLA class II histocompatibility antigen, DO alpha chain isoform X3 [Lemur catta]|uniref:HLA class II histocompatibility antigen, DO alpha chain isoform X3 n=1 Tax=Lemur catta TaxID=9447 RepID=UPI001E26AF5E|nr:HLA class II histocompatibility antigen, DO alpha chain isoform X3 [Lemur catta]
MALPARLVLGLHTLAILLSPQETGAIKADHMGSYGPAFYQSHGASGQFTYEFDGEQLFSVDLKKMPPRVTVIPKSRVELGQPNVLICIVDNIFPPVINITWLRNGQTVTEGVAQTSFYSQPDHLFRKFHYLTFVPSAEDVYDCRVEHWGLDEPLLRHWGMEPPPQTPPRPVSLYSRTLPCTLVPPPLSLSEPQVPTPPPDATETLLCALGLAMGLVGFLVGIILIITGTRLSSAPR